MDRTLEGYRAAAGPGPWRDALDAYAVADAAHRTLFARLAPHYEAYYDAPERTRPDLDPVLAESVRRIEESVAKVSAAREGIYPARDLAFATEAARLGGLPRVDGEPDWVRLMRDLHALRLWRRERLDGIDVHLAPFALNLPEKGRKEPSMLDGALQAWSKAAGVPLKGLRARLAALRDAGLVPGVASGPGDGGSAASERTLGRLVLAEGADALLAEVGHAATVLPEDAFPVPHEAMDALAAMTGPRPA